MAAWIRGRPGPPPTSPAATQCEQSSPVPAGQVAGNINVVDPAASPVAHHRPAHRSDVDHRHGAPKSRQRRLLYRERYGGQAWTEGLSPLRRDPAAPNPDRLRRLSRPGLRARNATAQAVMI